MSTDWGGWMGVQGTLLFWAKWLGDSLQHSPASTWPAVLLRFYATADPLASAVAVALLMAALCFLFSLPTNNHSFVDKIWSLVPVFYALHFALHDQLQHADVPLNPRLAIIAALATVWGARLTANFARKGGYRWDAEDYRWPYLRQRISPLAFLIFNLTFIALYQNLLLLSLVLPAYLGWQNAGTPLNALDALAAALAAFFITYETVADQQQWNFQSIKHAKLAAGKRLTGEYAKGFVTTGLFRYSRHPNFWAEQSLWCSMYLFGVAASGRWLNWTIAAPIQLILLFQGSTWLTEKLSAEKYPRYAQYQATTSCFFPWFPGSAPAGAAATPQKRSTRRSSQVAEAPPATPAAEPEPEAEEAQGTAVAPATAAKRRATRRKAGAAAAEEDQDSAPSGSARPARSPRKTARAMAAEEAAPTRQSRRLRTKASA